MGHSSHQQKFRSPQTNLCQIQRKFFIDVDRALNVENTSRRYTNLNSVRVIIVNEKDCTYFNNTLFWHLSFCFINRLHKGFLPLV